MKSCGTELHNRSEWASEVQSFCIERYHNPLVKPADQEQMRLQFIAQAQALEKKGVHLADFDISITMQARSNLKCGSAPGEDSLVAEMLLALPVETVYDLHDFFRRRIFGDDRDHVETWERFIL